jgi:dipeptidyl aminopeptidase/acylaminoacyl peptidase
MSLSPEDLAKLVLVSSPDVGGGRVLFTVTKVSLELNRYESSIWVCEGGSLWVSEWGGEPRHRVENFKEILN